MSEHASYYVTNVCRPNGCLYAEWVWAGEYTCNAPGMTGPHVVASFEKFEGCAAAAVEQSFDEVDSLFPSLDRFLYVFGDPVEKKCQPGVMTKEGFIPTEELVYPSEHRSCLQKTLQDGEERIVYVSANISRQG